MTERWNAQDLLRRLRNGVARLNRLLAEAGNSDEDLVFRIRNSTEESPFSDQKRRAPSPKRP
jgi:hypothetical protein